MTIWVLYPSKSGVNVWEVYINQFTKEIISANDHHLSAERGFSRISGGPKNTWELTLYVWIKVEWIKSLLPLVTPAVGLWFLDFGQQISHFLPKFLHSDSGPRFFLGLTRILSLWAVWVWIFALKNYPLHWGTSKVGGVRSEMSLTKSRDSP